MLIEVHMLKNHAPANLNRDDSGSPKECMFGGVRRARISSQCIKHSIRKSPVFIDVLGDNLGLRTKAFLNHLHEYLEGIQASGEEVSMICQLFPLLMASSSSIEEAKHADGEDESSILKTKQLIFSSYAEIEAVGRVMLDRFRENPAKFTELISPKKENNIKIKRATFARKIDVELRKIDNTEEYGLPRTIDVSLFGRMTTSAMINDVKSAVQVAHAISTHKIDKEYDYFTAVDDLSKDDEGAGMLSDVEYNSACFYKYFSIDYDGLCKNLTGESAGRSNIPDTEKQKAIVLANKAIFALIQSSILTTPSGKQNSFAAHQLPAAVLVEVRPYQTPVSYANAFVDPARAGRDGDLVAASLKKLATHVEALTSGFNLTTSGRWLLAPEHPDYVIAGVERVSDLRTLCARVQEVTLHCGKEPVHG